MPLLNVTEPSLPLTVAIPVTVLTMVIPCNDNTCSVYRTSIRVHCVHSNTLSLPSTCSAITLPSSGSITQMYVTTIIVLYFNMACGPGSSVGIATELHAGRSGIESRWGRDFPPIQTGPGAHPASCSMGTGSFPGVNCGRGVLLTTHPLLVPRSLKSRAIPLPTL